jgi:hypothetical protein
MRVPKRVLGALVALLLTLFGVWLGMKANQPNFAEYIE